MPWPNESYSMLAGPVRQLLAVATSSQLNLCIFPVPFHLIAGQPLFHFEISLIETRQVCSLKASSSRFLFRLGRFCDSALHPAGCGQNQYPLPRSKRGLPVAAAALPRGCIGRVQPNSWLSSRRFLQCSQSHDFFWLHEPLRT